MRQDVMGMLQTQWGWQGGELMVCYGSSEHVKELEATPPVPIPQLRDQGSNISYCTAGQ